MSNTKLDLFSSKEHFLAAMHIQPKKFADSGLTWADILDIKNDYEDVTKQKAFESAKNRLVTIVSRFEHAHSISARIKSVDSLVAKIIDRMSKKREREISAENYLTKITDIIGIRILHLLKSDGVALHRQIINEFEKFQVEKPVIYLRRGDSDAIYDSIKTSVEKIEPDSMYRSIHYVYRFPKKGKQDLCRWELQTRTLFQEGWSELDHDLIYKERYKDDETLRSYSDALSRIVGTCDDLAMFIQRRSETLINENKIDPADEPCVRSQDDGARDKERERGIFDYLDVFFERMGGSGK